jgi:GLPGLI family protein
MTKQLLLLSLLAGASTTLWAQESAPPMIIKASQVMTPPDNGGDDPNPPQETNITVWVKGPHIKSESKSDVTHNITIVDKDAKKTTQLYENAGRKYGYYSIDTPRTRPQRLDSAGNPVQRRAPNVEYVDSTKKIAGYTCKKAVVTMSFGNRSISTEIWYTTDLPIKEPIQTGGGGRGFNFGGFNDLKGFPMAFTTNISNGPRIEYKVTKITTNADIKDTEFDVPKGYDVKPESERPRGQGFGGGGFRGGGGGPPGGGGRF